MSFPEGSPEHKAKQPQGKNKQERMRVKSSGKGRATYIPIIKGDEVRQSGEPVDAEALLRQINGLKRPPIGDAQAKDD